MMDRMTGSAPQAPRWADYAFQRLADGGRRRGGARTAVIDLLGRHTCALSAGEIEDALSTADRGVARASVYRVLEELEALALVTRVDVGDGVSRYEAQYPDGANHHHHMVCRTCGELVPFHDDELERTIRRLSRRVDFAVTDHDVLLRGHCHDCQHASARAPVYADGPPKNAGLPTSG
jgi:Fur family transcriptional regulator, ferric uptake regulator